MKKLLVLVAPVLLTACSATQAKFAEVHEDVFGCPPEGVERSLGAEGPTDETPRDFLGNECGKPVYEKPECPPGS